MKIACYIATALFLLFSYFQINDVTQYQNHDNWFWILYYLATAALSFWLTRRHLPRPFLSGCVGFSLGAALFRMMDGVGNFDFSAPFRATAIPSHMNATTQAPNEIGGLLLVAAWLLFLTLRADRACHEAKSK
ncbi:MAG: transmembrane 220 family protein [Verrucomicrobiales bacterium]